MYSCFGAPDKCFLQTDRTVRPLCSESRCVDLDRPGYAFYGRIEASAERHRTDVAKVLGYVIAHELGHILLARGTHSSAGIMNGRWGQFQMDLVADSLLRFTIEQAKLIRSSAAEMNKDYKRQAGNVVQ
jgi:hypothetical protein